MRSGQVRELRPFGRYADGYVIADRAVQFARGQCGVARVDYVVRQSASAAIHIRNAYGICFDAEVRRAHCARQIHVKPIVRKNAAEHCIAGRIVFRRIGEKLIAANGIEAIENGEVTRDFGGERRPLSRVARFIVGIFGNARFVRISFERIVCSGIDRRSSHAVNLLAKSWHHGHGTAGR